MYRGVTRICDIPPLFVAKRPIAKNNTEVFKALQRKHQGDAEKGDDQSDVSEGSQLYDEKNSKTQSNEEYLHDGENRKCLDNDDLRKYQIEVDDTSLLNDTIDVNLLEELQLELELLNEKEREYKLESQSSGVVKRSLFGFLDNQQTLEFQRKRGVLESRISKELERIEEQKKKIEESKENRIIYLNEYHRKLFENAPLEDPSNSSDSIVWVDMEMTGLSIENDKVCEIACLITDGNCRIIAEHEPMVIKDEDTIELMDDWCKETHGKSGLIREINANGIDLQTAENRLLQFVRKFSQSRKAVLAGNTIYTDKMFMQNHLPNLHKHFSYRVIDVSSMAELARRWNLPSYLSRPQKKVIHRARPDIWESVFELMHYQRTMIKCVNKLTRK